MKPQQCARYAALALVFLSLALVLPAVSQGVLSTPSGSGPTAFIPSSLSDNITTSSFTQTCIVTGTVISPDSCIVNSFPYMAIGLLLSFMLIAIVYMVGNVMNYKPLKDWYKKELWEAIKTIILIGVIISALVITSALADILVGAQYTQPLQNGNTNVLSANLAGLYNADSVYVGQQLNQSYQAYAALLGLSTGIGLLKSISLSLWIPVPLFTPTIPPVIFGSVQFGSVESLLVSNFIAATPGESSYSLTQSLTQIIVIPMLIFFQFQSSFFFDLMTLGLGVLIPLGIIFRAFPFVRDIGGTLLATGIGIAIVYPALILILNMPVSNYIYAFTYSQTLSNSCPFSSGFLCKGWSAITTLVAGFQVPPALVSAGAASPSIVTAAAVGGLPIGGFVKYPLIVALGTTAANNANVIGAMADGYYVGFLTPLTSGVYPTLNLIMAQTLGMILQFILIAVDLLVGLLITGAITNMLGGKVRLGIGSKLGISTGR